MTPGRRLGVQLPEVERFVPWPELLAIARTAEAAGLDSLWLGDHLLYDLPDGSVRGPWEVWTSLAAVAVATERITLGPLVASLAFHDPAMVAKLVSTVEGIAPGRLVVGVGAGWNEREFRAFGLPFDRRVDRFEEAFLIVHRLLAGEEVTHHGVFFDVDRCRIDPLTGNPPLMVGSIAPRMLRITSPFAQWWNVWYSQYGNDPQVLRGVVEVVNQRCVRPLRGSAAVYVQAPGGRGRSMGGDGTAPLPVRGTVAEVADQLVEFFSAGVEMLQVVLDPITVDAVSWLGEVAATLGATRSGG